MNHKIGKIPFDHKMYFNKVPKTEYERKNLIINKTPIIMSLEDHLKNKEDKFKSQEKSDILAQVSNLQRFQL